MIEITDKALKRACVPEKYWSHGIGDIEEPYKTKSFNAIKLIEKLLKRKQGEGVLVLGPPSSGKTSFCSIVIRMAMEKEYSTFFIRANDLHKREKEFVPNNQKKITYYQKYRKVDLVILDELCSNDIKQIKYIEYCLRQRYENNKTTIINSNLDSNSLNTLYRGAFISLIKRACPNILVLDNYQWVREFSEI